MPKPWPKWKFDLYVFAQFTLACAVISILEFPPENILIVLLLQIWSSLLHRTQK